MFRGLALVARFDRDIAHDARKPLPFADESVEGFQSQDVFEHMEYAKVSATFDEIYRCLKIGGIFRLSLPDYNSPVLAGRSVYDSQGRILCDLAMGGRVECKLHEDIKVSFIGGGDSHLWFPTYAKVARLILASELRKCTSITFHHAWLDAHDFIREPFDQSVMPVSRTPPGDMRAGGKPVSIVVDFVK
jgi:SAM-dependent methyltransferase